MTLTVGNCTGRVMFRLGRFSVELWRVPKGEHIPRHTHEHVVSRFIFLDRNLCVHRTGSTQTRAVPWLRWYRVGAGQAHWAEADRGPAKFLNLEWWTGNGAAESAAQDFQTR